MKVFFTGYQYDELEQLVHIRLETITDDIGSADDFELEGGNVESLLQKLRDKSKEFNSYELQYLTEECESRLKAAEAHPLQESFGLIRSMNNAIKKIKKAINPTTEDMQTISKNLMIAAEKLSSEWNNSAFVVLNIDETLDTTVWNKHKYEDPKRPVVAYVDGSGWKVPKDFKTIFKLEISEGFAHERSEES